MVFHVSRTQLCEAGDGIAGDVPVRSTGDGIAGFALRMSVVIRQGCVKPATVSPGTVLVRPTGDGIAGFAL